MKKLFCLLCLLLVMQSSRAQRMPDGIADPELWKKSRTQRTAAFVLLGAGAVTTLVGFSVSAGNMFIDLIRSRRVVRGTGAMIAGATMMAGSIPFFMMSNKNRRLSLLVSNFPQLQSNNQQLFTYHISHQLTLTLTEQIFK